MRRRTTPNPGPVRWRGKHERFHVQMATRFGGSMGYQTDTGRVAEMRSNIPILWGDDATQQVPIPDR